MEFHAVKGFAESLPFPAAQFDGCSLDLWVMCGWAKFSEQNWRLCWYLLALCPPGVDLHTAHWDYVLIYNFVTYNLLYSPTFKLRQCGQATEDVDRHLEKMDEETRWKMGWRSTFGVAGDG